MRNAVTALPILLALLAAAQGSPQPHSEGRISGILLYPNGARVPKGRVVVTGARREGENPELLSTATDQDGRFEFRHLRFTSYWFGAEKEDEAYADAQAIDLQGGVRLTHPDGVKLTPATPTARVALKLEPKWGILSGTVEDRITHQPVVAVLRFKEPIGSSDGHRYFHDYFRKPAPGSFRVLLQPSTDLLLEVEADGYKPWFYPEVSEQSSLLLRLESGEQKSLKIELEREAKDHLDGVRP